MAARAHLRNPLATIVRQVQADRGEYKKIALLFGYLFFVVAASTIGRTAADTLFLSKFDASALSYMYLPQAVILLVSGIVYQRLCKRFRADQLAVAVIIGASVASVVSRVAVGAGYSWIFPVIYIGYDDLNFLLIVCFWQFATSVMDQRKAKRTIGLVGSGGIVGGILSGFGLKLLVQPLGTENLIIVYAGAQLLCLLLVIMLIRSADNADEIFEIKPAEKQASRKSRHVREEKKGLFQSVPHLKYVAIMAGTLVVSLTLIDYQFKVILRNDMQNEQLASFMGSFYGFAGLLALCIQLFISGKLITRFGVTTAIIVFPIVLFTGSLVFLFIPVLAIATMVKASDKVLGDTVHSSVGQLIMFPIPPEWRNQAKSFLDGIVRNVAKGLAAVSLIVLSWWLPAEKFGYLVLVLMGCCIVAAIKIKKTYLALLLSTLQSKGMDMSEELDFVDPAGIQVMVDALHSADKREVLYAFSILKSVQEFDMNPHLEKLLAHPDREVQIEAIKFIQLTTPADGEQKLAPLLIDADADIHGHAILALSAYAHEEQLERIAAYLQKSNVTIRAAAIAGLIKYYGIEGMFHAVGTLKQLLESEHAAEREAMSALFGQIGIKSFYKPLIPMLHDSSRAVRIRALESAGLLCVPELVPHIVPLLRESQTRQQAVAALTSYEEKTIVPLLSHYLTSKEEHVQLPSVFEKIGSKAALDALLRNYMTLSVELREKVLEAANRIPDSAVHIDRSHCEQVIAQEISEYWEWTRYSHALAGHTVGEPLSEAAEQARVRHVKRIFQLLALLYDTKTIQAVYANWSGGNARQQANAVEVIDQLLTGKLRTEITQIISSSVNIDDAPVELDRDDLLNWISERGDAWTRRTVEYARASGEQRASDTLFRQIEILKNVSLFSGLTGRDLFKIAGHLHAVHMREGDEIVRQMDNGDSLYLIERGTAGIYINNTRIKELAAYDYFGEMSVITERPRSATVIAEQPMELWELTSNAFYEIIFDHTEIAVEMMKHLSLRLRSTNAKIAQPTQQAAQEVGAGSEQQRYEHETESLAVATDEGRNQTIIRRILVLQKISLFAHCSQNDFIKLAQMVEESVYEAGEIICSTGEDGDTMYGIIEGGVWVHQGAKRLATLEVGQCFGEMAIIDGQPRSADCTAAERTILLELKREQVFDFCFQHMYVLKGMMRFLAERTLDAEQHV